MRDEVTHSPSPWRVLAKPSPLLIIMRCCSRLFDSIAPISLLAKSVAHVAHKKSFDFASRLINGSECSSGFITKLYKNIEGKVSLYIHIPFCVAPCRFCCFVRFPYKEDRYWPYMKALQVEIEETRSKLEEAQVESVYIGGGTPSVNDEGLVWLLTEMQKNGDIPEDVVFKVSIYAGHASAAGGRVLQMLGADTFNPLGDLSLPQLASIREAVDIPLDLHIILAESFGGYNRFYDGPDMARTCAPCYFKIEPGPSVAGLYRPWVSPQHLAFLVREKVKYAEIIIDIVERVNPDIKVSGRGPADLAIPKP